MFLALWCMILYYPHQKKKKKVSIHSKNCWVVLTQLGQIWTNLAIGLHFFNYIFNPTFGFVHI